MVQAGSETEMEYESKENLITWSGIYNSIDILIINLLKIQIEIEMYNEIESCTIVMP